MIEHFKKFDSQIKSLLPLSFSHLNEFAFNRERWALRRIFGYEFPTSAAAIRGSVVETGLNMIMGGAEYEVAKEKMMYDFEVNVSKINDPKTEEERDYLEPLLKIGLDSFHNQALNWNLLNYQKKVELTIKDIPFVGYTDFHFEDKTTKEDFYQTPMKLCEHIVTVMGNYLAKLDSIDDVKDSLIPNPDDWIWKDEAVLKARKEVWGY